MDVALTPDEDSLALTDEEVPIITDVEADVEDTAELEEEFFDTETEDELEVASEVTEADNAIPLKSQSTVAILRADVATDDDSSEDTDVVAELEADSEEAVIALKDDNVHGEDRRVFIAPDGERLYAAYDYSFKAKLLLAASEVQGRYSVISDVLLSYGLKLQEERKNEIYFSDGKIYASLAFGGKMLCVFLAIEPHSLDGTKYVYENVGGIKKYEKLPVMVKVRSARSCKYAIELIKMMFDSAKIKQIRAEKASFEYRTENIDKLIECGEIKVITTSSDGEPILNVGDLELKKAIPLKKRISVSEVSEISDDDILAFIETENSDTGEFNGRRKAVVNIDTVSNAYVDGDTVTLKNLIEKKLVPKNTEFVKILASGELDKSLTVKAHEFAVDAVKMITVTGGRAVRLKPSDKF